MTAYETLRAKQDELQALSDEASQQVEVSSKDAGSREKLEAELVASETDAADKYIFLIRQSQFNSFKFSCSWIFLQTSCYYGFRFFHYFS